MSDDRMLARIAALLRQAEGTDNAHEVEAFAGRGAAPGHCHID